MQNPHTVHIILVLNYFEVGKQLKFILVLRSYITTEKSPALWKESKINTLIK